MHVWRHWPLPTDQSKKLAAASVFVKRLFRFRFLNSKCICGQRVYATRSSRGINILGGGARCSHRAVVGTQQAHRRSTTRSTNCDGLTGLRVAIDYVKLFNLHEPRGAIVEGKRDVMNGTLFPKEGYALDPRATVC